MRLAQADEGLLGRTDSFRMPPYAHAPQSAMASPTFFIPTSLAGDEGPREQRRRRYSNEKLMRTLASSRW